MDNYNWHSLDLHSDYVNQELEQLIQKMDQKIVNNSSSSNQEINSNGRLVRKIFEKTIERQAVRLAKMKNINKDMMVKIVSKDIDI